MFADATFLALGDPSCFCGEALNTTAIGPQLYFASVELRDKRGGHVERVLERERKTCFELSRVPSF